MKPERGESPSLAARRRLLQEVKALEGEVTKAATVRGKAEGHRSDFAGRVAEVIRTSNAVVEAALARATDKAPHLAFATLVQGSAAGLAAAVASGQVDVLWAMATNLGAMARALDASRVEVVPAARREAWRASIAALGTPVPPAPREDPHPEVFTYAALLTQVRDRGLQLGSLGEIYLLSDRGLHVVR